MTQVFFWIALVITLVFFVQALVFAFCQWIIYFRVERTTLNIRNERKK